MIMKPGISLIALFVLTIASACKKTYNCSCTYPGFSKTYQVKETSQDNARKQCAASFHSENDTIPDNPDLCAIPK